MNSPIDVRVPEAVERQTHVYKLADGCEIKADVFGAAPGASKPCVMWIHGGGLIFGSRKKPRPAFLAALLEQGAIVVSIDHRLAPETKLPDILDDVRDAWQWLHTQGPALLGIDSARIGVAGGSSGGYLTLMSGFCAQPRPRALASFWGFGDITTPWEAQPSAHYRERPLITVEEAWDSVGKSAISEDPEILDRGYFYLYCRQQGLWPVEVAGHDPYGEPRWFDAWCPIRNVTATYPPTILLHGELDNDVPCEESQNMAARLAEVGIEYELLVVEGAGHGLGGVPVELVASIEGRAAAFLLSRLR